MHAGSRASRAQVASFVRPSTPSPATRTRKPVDHPKEEAVPQARSSGSKSASTSGGSQTRRSSAGKSTGAKSTTRKSASSSSRASGTRASRAAGSASSSGAGAKSNGAAADPRLEAVAQRIRKLNERIIEEGKSAGEATLSSYEKALKAIASTLERGPGKSDIEWISSLASAQAKFIRDVTDAWTSAARGMLK
jgi:hypothetical protein